jgi:hypothetical protein
MTLNGQEIGAGENQPHFRTRAPGPQIFIIPHRQQFVKRKVAQKLNNYFSRICALLPVDFWCGLWYTIDVKGRGKPPTDAETSATHSASKQRNWLKQSKKM